MANRLLFTKLKILLFLMITLTTYLSSSYIVVSIVCMLSIFILVATQIYIRACYIEQSETSLFRLKTEYLKKKSFILFGMTNISSNTVSKTMISLLISSILGIAKEIMPYLKLLVVIFILKLFTTKNFSISLFGTLQAFTVIILSIIIFKTIKFMNLMYVIDDILSPLKRIGVNSEKITLLFVLTFRFFFMLKEVYTEVLYAQKARGVESYKISLMIPFILRALKKSRNVAEALLVRL